MNIFEDTNPRALKDLLGEVHALTMILPDFQRDFVWEPGATQELITSIANNYPAGSILRVRDTHRIFAAASSKVHPRSTATRTRFWYWMVSSGSPHSTRLFMVSANIVTTSI